MTDAAIEVKGLVKSYPKGVRALDGVSFDVEPGSVFGLLGPNGAGKSTTVKILTTLSRPDQGEAHVTGIDVLRHPDRVRRAIGCVAQSSGVDVNASGRENLLLQGRLYDMGGRELEQRVDTLLELTASHVIEATLEEQVLAPAGVHVNARALRYAADRAAHAVRATQHVEALSLIHI